VTNVGTDRLEWSLSRNDYFGPWVSCIPDRGFLNGSQSVTVVLSWTTQLLTPGMQFTTTFLLSSSKNWNTGSILNVSISLSTVSGPVLNLWPWPEATITVPFGQATESMARLRNVGASSLHWQASIGDSSITLMPPSGVLEALDYVEIHIRIPASSRAVGTYSTNLTISSDELPSKVISVETTVLNITKNPENEIEGPELTVSVGESFVLDGSESDGSRLNGSNSRADIVSYEWYEVFSSLPFFATGSSINVTLLSEGTYVFQLVVTDANGAISINEYVVVVGNDIQLIPDPIIPPPPTPTPPPADINTLYNRELTAERVLANSQAAGIITSLICIVVIISAVMLHRYKRRRYLDGFADESSSSDNRAHTRRSNEPGPSSSDTLSLLQNSSFARRAPSNDESNGMPPVAEDPRLDDDDLRRDSHELLPDFDAFKSRADAPRPAGVGTATFREYQDNTLFDDPELQEIQPSLELDSAAASPPEATLVVRQAEPVFSEQRQSVEGVGPESSAAYASLDERF